MRRLAWVAASTALVLSLAAAGCQRKASHELDAELEAALRSRSTACLAAAQQGEAERFAACFGIEAVLVAPGLLAGRGPEEILHALQEWMSQPDFRLTLRMEGLDAVQGREGNAVAQEYGRYELTHAGNNFAYTYSITWRRDPGADWHADLFLLDVESTETDTP
jgi:hypothetical protein